MFVLKKNKKAMASKKAKVIKKKGKSKKEISKNKFASMSTDDYLKNAINISQDNSDDSSTDSFQNKNNTTGSDTGWLYFMKSYLYIIGNIIAINRK